MTGRLPAFAPMAPPPPPPPGTPHPPAADLISDLKNRGQTRFHLSFPRSRAGAPSLGPAQLPASTAKFPSQRTRVTITRIGLRATNHVGGRAMPNDRFVSLTGILMLRRF